MSRLHDDMLMSLAIRPVTEEDREVINAMLDQAIADYVVDKERNILLINKVLFNALPLPYYDGITGARINVYIRHGVRVVPSDYTPLDQVEIFSKLN